MKFGELWDLMAKEINEYQRDKDLDLNELFNSKVSIHIHNGANDEKVKITDFIGLCGEEVLFIGDKRG